MQRIFVNRTKFLSLLGNMKDSLIRGNIRENLTLIGLRRIGKTLIVKEFAKQNQLDNDVIIAYIDLERMDMVPELFAAEYIGAISAWYFKDKEDIIENYHNLDYTLSKIREFKEPYNLVFSLKQDLSMVNYNYADAIRKAFQFPDILASAADKKIIIIFDEFQEIRGLNNYQNIDILKIFRSIMQTQSNVLYIFLGSAISFMEQVFKESTSPLYLQSRIEYVDYLTREDSIMLSKNILGNSENLYRIYELTNGHPYYIYSLCKRLESISDTGIEYINNEKINEAFVIEALTTGGRIYNLCHYVLENSINRARGSTLLKSILKIIAKDPDLRISDIAKGIKRPVGATRNLINRLKDVDLLDETNGGLFIRDPIMQYWIVHYYFGSELTQEMVKKSLKQLVSEFQEKYVRASTELGRAKEYEFKVKLEKAVGLNLDNYISEDGQIEFDLVGKKGKTMYIIEIKWRNKAVDYKDVENFLNKVSLSGFKNVKLYFVSKTGFTKKAWDLMKKEGIIDVGAEVLTYR